MRLEFGVFITGDERIIICVLPVVKDKFDLTPQERDFVLPFIGDYSCEILQNVWDCGDDANVISRLHVCGLRPGDRPRRILQICHDKGFFDNEEEEE